MHTREILLRRSSVVSTRSFEDVVERLTAPIGRPDMSAFRRAIAAAKNVAELEALVRAAIGASELMEFARYDSGEVLRKEGRGPKLLRLVVGNPLIMREMARSVPDAASYAPVTILVDERADGVHLSYDTMASALAPYESAGALAIAERLDAKIHGLLEAAAA